MQPGHEAIEEVSDVDELENGRNKWIGDPQEEYFLNEPFALILVVLDVDIGDEWHKDGVHQLGNDGF